MSVLQGLERLVEDEFADGRSLWAPLQNAMGVVPRITSYAFGLKQTGPRIEIQSQLEMDRRIVELRRRLNDVVQVDGVIETGQVSQTGHSVDALVLLDLRLQHSPNRNGEAVPLGSCLIPGKLIIQGHLPALDVVLPVGIPKAVEAGGQGNRPLDLGRLGNEDNVGVSKLRRQKCRSFHLGKKSC